MNSGISPPEGYRKLPAGARCRCIRLWFDGTDHWCCDPKNNPPPASPDSILGSAIFGMTEAASEVDRLKAALRYGIGAAINELEAQNLPREWSPGSGIGVMLAALGCKSTRYDDAVKAALEDRP